MRSATMGGGEIGVPWCLRKRWHPSFFSHRTGCTQSLPRHVYLDLFFLKRSCTWTSMLCCDAINEAARLVK